jgi:hypothetical protein
MRLPRVRFTLRAMMVWIVILAGLFVTARSALGYLGYLGLRDGVYQGSYRYLGSDWKWHEIRGNILTVKHLSNDGLAIFVDSSPIVFSNGPDGSVDLEPNPWPFATPDACQFS